MSHAEATTHHRRVVGWAVVFTLAVAIFGLVARLQIMIAGLARPMSANIFTRLYAMHEQPFLVLLLLSALLTALVLSRARVPDGSPAGSALATPPSNRALLTVAIVVFVTLLATTAFVMRGFLFSMDEFSADFQARIFASGRVVAPLPTTWRALAQGISPIFVTYRPDSGSWLSAYLPFYALMKAPFVALHVAVLLNPLLGALSIVLIGACARRLWPNEGTRPWLAVALLATSSQFVMTSATGYSMPAHLCLNLLWLWLYLRGDERSWLVALGVGVIALGLHNPFPHALFVAPFLVRLLYERRWRRLAQAAVIYGVGAAALLAWLRFSYPSGQSGAGLTSLFAVPTTVIFWINGVSLSLLFTWQAPLLGLLAVAAIIRLRQLSAPLADLAFGLMLTLAFFLFFPSTQGHGWGHRYAYQVLGSLALLAAAGLEPLISALGARRAERLVGSSLLVALFLQLPLRTFQTERFVRPFAAGYGYVASRSADVVIVHTDSIWYGRDMVRNDPFLQGQPVVVGADRITPAQRTELERTYPGRIVEVSNQELLDLGMTRWLSNRR